MRLGDFTEDEVRSLLDQHTPETAQEFERGAVSRIWALTRGQPWLVNALAWEACFEDEAGRDRGRPIAIDAIEGAKDRLIANRVTHLDQLAARLAERRVGRVLEPILAAVEPREEIPEDDLDYVCDLGLLRPGGSARIANPIYQEVIPRQLMHSTVGLLNQRTRWYKNPDGSLRLSKLLSRFQQH